MDVLKNQTAAANHQHQLILIELGSVFFACSKLSHLKFLSKQMSTHRFCGKNFRQDEPNLQWHGHDYPETVMFHRLKPACENSLCNPRMKGSCTRHCSIMEGGIEASSMKLRWKHEKLRSVEMMHDAWNFGPRDIRSSVQFLPLISGVGGRRSRFAK